MPQFPVFSSEGWRGLLSAGDSVSSRTPPAGEEAALALDVVSPSKARASAQVKNAKALLSATLWDADGVGSVSPVGPSQSSRTSLY